MGGVGWATELVRSWWSCILERNGAKGEKSIQLVAETSVVELMAGRTPTRLGYQDTRVPRPVISCCDTLVKGDYFTKATGSSQGIPQGQVWEQHKPVLG